MKTQDLTGAALDWAVAKCEYPKQSVNTALGFPYLVFGRFNPSVNWAQGGPIIEREISAGMRLQKDFACYYVGGIDSFAHLMRGPTPLIAALRCFVASRLGDTVDIPEELT